MNSQIKTLIHTKTTFSNMVLMVFLLTLTGTAFGSTTWYVNGLSGSNTNNCKSPTSACKTIGHAISLASSSDSVMVAAATYGENVTISKSLTILGSGAQTTIIDGGGVNTVVTISNSAARVTLSQLTIRHGFAQNGGGIYNSGTLTINHCVVRGNSAKGPGIQIGRGGGIYSAGNLTINNSTIQSNGASGGVLLNQGVGGGILAGGMTTINKSNISGNNAGGGGGIDASGPTTINNSTISGNSASGGGGIAGGGTLTINNTTVSGNSAYGAGQGCGHYACPGLGGGIDASGPTTINNSTISGNNARNNHPQGGGVYGNATLQNSIVANSSSGGNCSGTMTSHGYNLSSDNTCNFHSSGDRNNINPLLGPLQNNGGPTLTMALPSGSPAIDAGNPSGCKDGSGHILTTDQRGYPRHDPEDTKGCDMGAFERQSD